jgi:RHS repeat-associated protein
MHEHLDDFALINMNGRVYDPQIARFLSPDPQLQAPGYWLNYNRYGYALNNPLIYTDPSGEFFFSALLPGVGTFIDAACWGAVIGGAGYTAGVAFSDGGFSNWNCGQFGKSVGMGAISGVATAGIGQMYGPVGSMGVSGEVARAYTHGFAQGMISAAFGGDFMTGFATGGLSSMAGSAFMMYGGTFASSTFGTYAFSGVAGGVGAELTGDNFFEGAAIGVMNAGLNHLESMVGEAGARYYANKKAGYKDMWDNSFVDGKPYREVSAWELENGDMIMLPYNKNKIDISYNKALKTTIGKTTGNRYVYFNGKRYEISTHAHTHPQMVTTQQIMKGSNPIGIGPSDLKLQQRIGRPIHILYNRAIYSFPGTYNHEMNMYNFKRIGTW